MEEIRKIGFAENLQEYKRTQVELAKLQITDKVSESGSQIISQLLIGTFLLLAFLFLSISAGFYFTQLMGSLTKGFGLIGAVYFTIGTFMFLLRKPLLILPLRDRIIRHILAERI